jgi:hypothetical protein
MFPPWARLAETVAFNGFSPVPLRPGTKKPRFSKWSRACYAPPDPPFISAHATRFPTDSVGLACGRVREGEDILGWLFVLDCDAEDPAESSRIAEIVRATLGETPLIRFGRFPRWSRIYRASGPIRSAKGLNFEILGAGRQLVAFGLHPLTSQPYLWTEETPVSITAQSVPMVGASAISELKLQLGLGNHHPFLPEVREFGSRPSFASTNCAILPDGCGSLRWTSNEAGIVIDGREAFLAWCVAKKNGDARAAWELFTRHADLARPKRNGSNWAFADAQKKAD